MEVEAAFLCLHSFANPPDLLNGGGGTLPSCGTRGGPSQAVPIRIRIRIRIRIMSRRRA